MKEDYDPSKPRACTTCGDTHTMEAPDGGIVYCDCLGDIKYEDFMEALLAHGCAPKKMEHINNPPEPGTVAEVIPMKARRK